MQGWTKGKITQQYLRTIHLTKLFKRAILCFYTQKCTPAFVPLSSALSFFFLSNTVLKKLRELGYQLSAGLFYIFRAISAKHGAVISMPRRATKEVLRYKKKKEEKKRSRDSKTKAFFELPAGRKVSPERKRSVVCMGERVEVISH